MAASKKSGISQKVIQKCIEPFFESILETLIEGNKITIANFGTFYVKEMKERMGRNPQTGEKIKVGAKKVIKFKSTSNINTEGDSNLR